MSLSAPDEDAIERVVRENLLGLRAGGAVALTAGALVALAVGADEARRAQGGNAPNLAAWAVVLASVVFAALGGVALLRGLRPRAHPLFRTLTAGADSIVGVQVVGLLHRPRCQVRLQLAGGRAVELVARGDAAAARALFERVAPRAAAQAVADGREGAPLERPGVVFGTDAEEVLHLTALVDRQLRPFRRAGLGLLVGAALCAGVGALEWDDAGLADPAPVTAWWAFGAGALLAAVGAGVAWRSRPTDGHPLVQVLVTHRAEITGVEVVRVVNSWADRVVVRSPRAAQPVVLLVDHRERDSTVALLTRACGKEASELGVIDRP